MMTVKPRGPYAVLRYRDRTETITEAIELIGVCEVVSRSVYVKGSGTMIKPRFRNARFTRLDDWHVAEIGDLLSC